MRICPPTGLPVTATSRTRWSLTSGPGALTGSSGPRVARRRITASLPAVHATSLGAANNPRMDLFAALPQTVADDAEGGIRYFPDVVDAATADAWFAALRHGVRWKLQDRPMYDRMVTIPRLLASFLLEDAPGALPLRHRQHFRAAFLRI